MEETILVSTEPVVAPPVTSLGQFTLLRDHAKGGLGAVSLAHDNALKRDVALKRIRPDRAAMPNVRARFLNEAQVTAQLDHPGVVPIYLLAEDADGQPYYAMRFIQGRTLSEAIRSFYRVPSALAFRDLLLRFVTACQTVAYAHSKGIIHRDIKPGNIMLGDYGETLVVDWGLAKRFGVAEAPSADDGGEHETSGGASTDELTQAGQILGTPPYMSPEQARGGSEAVGPAADIYSLGAVLYEILTGRPPYKGQNCGEILEKLRQSPPRRPGAVRRGVPAALDAVCGKAMARLPSERYATATQLSADIERWLADEPVAVFKEPRTMRLGRWARRHRPMVAALAATGVLLLVVCVTGFYLWDAAQRRQQRQIEHHRADLLRSATAQEQIAQADIHSGRFSSAAGVLRDATHLLSGDAALDSLRERLEARLRRAQSLDEFYRGVHRGEVLMTFEQDEDGKAAFEGAMAALKVFDHADWWNHLPTDDLTDFQRARLERDVHLYLLLLGGIRAREGLLNFGDPASAQAYQSGLAAVEAAQRFRRSYAGVVGQSLARLALGQSPAGDDPDQSGPTSFVDYYLIGLLNYWVADYADDVLTRLILSRLPGLGVLDLKNPMATGERYLRTAAALEPDHFWTHYWLGETLRAAKKPEAAQLAYATCIALRPDDWIGYIKRAATLLDEHDSAADDLERRRLLERAVIDVETAVRVTKNDGHPYYFRGIISARKRDWEKALADYTTAIDIHARHASAADWMIAFYFRERGITFFRLNRHDEAIKDLTQAIERHPLHVARIRSAVAGSYAWRALVRREKGELEKSVADYSEAITFRPNSSYYSGRALAQLRMGDPQRALEDCSEALRLDSKSGWSYYVRAATHTRRGNHPEALADLRRAHAVGFFSDPVNLKNLKTDPDLAAFRASPQFTTFLGELQSAAPTSDRKP
jgi:tetratricopeptide (TPR) repeat protein/tRNA A-37 threonylcarbamoyl transferase component Bud32